MCRKEFLLIPDQERDNGWIIRVNELGGGGGRRSEKKREGKRKKGEGKRKK